VISVGSILVRKGGVGRPEQCWRRIYSWLGVAQFIGGEAT